MSATPRCPHCQAKGLKHLAQKQIGPYLLVYCGHCGAIFGFVPDLLKKSPKPATGHRPARHSPVFDVIGRADITHKEPYSPQKIAARMRAASVNRGSLYMQVAEDYGPPVCPEHKADMVQDIVPEGYPHEGLKVWICPKFEACQSWEIVEE